MATRIYLPSSGSASVTPDYEDTGSWDDISAAARLPMSRTKAGSAMTTVTFTDSDATDKDILLRQFIMDLGLAAQTIAAQTVKIQIREAEISTFGGANLFLSWVLKVVSSDGTLLRGALVGTPRRDDTELASGSNPTPQNRGDSLTCASLAVQAGDLLVLEVGVGGDPGAGSDHDSRMVIGDDNASDLPEDDTTTTALNPWIEFANDLVFLSKTLVAPSSSQRLFSQLLPLYDAP